MLQVEEKESFLKGEMNESIISCYEKVQSCMVLLTYENATLTQEIADV